MSPSNCEVTLYLEKRIFFLKFLSSIRSQKLYYVYSQLLDPIGDDGEKSIEEALKKIREKC